MQYLKQFSYGRRLLFFLSNSMCGVCSMSVCVVDVLRRDHIEHWWHRQGCQVAAVSCHAVCPQQVGGATRSVLLHRQVLPAELWVWSRRGRRQGLSAL